LKSEWERQDTNKDGLLSYNEVKSLLRVFNMKPRDSELKKEIKELDGDNSGNMDFSEFLALYDNLAFRPEIEVIFKEHATGEESSVMTIEDLRKFLTTTQGVTNKQSKQANKL